MMQPRTTFAIVLTTVALLASNLIAAQSPNVVIFYADDMGRGDVGAYGCQDIQTPNIDRIARDGIRFMNYYSAAPVCSPSRAALLTGRYPARAGVPSNCSSMPGDPGMPGTEITLAELAGSRGYTTALIGKWHLGFSDETRPNVQGFDYFFGHHAGCIDYYSHMFYWRAPHHHDLYRNREEIHEEGAYFTNIIAREAMGFIDANKDRRFLLYVPFNAPHYPLQAPERFRKMYAHLPEKRRDYAPLVGAMDEAIGQIVDRLDQYKLTDNTLLFFMSDNGISVEVRNNFGGGNSGGFRGHKGELFEGGIRMPGIVSWPAVLPKNETRDQIAIAMDVFPTVAAAIGAELPTDRVIDGLSWLELLKNPDVPGRKTLFWSYGGKGAVRQGKWKLVQRGLKAKDKGNHKQDEDAIFLADIETDPAETTNLRRKHPEVLDQLIKQHQAWQKSVEEDLKSRR